MIRGASRIAFRRARSSDAKRQVESFNGRLRDEFLDEFLNENAFPSLARARAAIDEWRHDYNHHRPHTSLGGLTPAEFLRDHSLTNSRSRAA
jgi:putative transposase